jgi:hypothetical protein
MNFLDCLYAKKATKNHWYPTLQTRVDHKKINIKLGVFIAFLKKKMHKEKRLARSAVVIGLLFCVVVIWQALAWYTTAYLNFDRYLEPGEAYTVGSRSYTLPNLQAQGRPYLLKEKFIQRQRDLFIRVGRMFESCGIQAWVSGGTLLGLSEYGTFIPWDDDIDMHTFWKNRETLYDPGFAKVAHAHGLEVVILLNSNARSTHKDGSAVRFRHRWGLTPVCDVFFVHQVSGSRVAKVDSWSPKGAVTSQRELWDEVMLFPLQKRTIDDLEVWLPNQPVLVLKQQYGQNVTNVMKVRHPLYSHEYFYRVFSRFWVAK